MAEVLAPELGADAHLPRQAQDLLLELHVAEGASVLVARRRQRVVVLKGERERGGNTKREGQVGQCLSRIRQVA